MKPQLRILGKLLFLVLALSLTECAKNKSKSQQVKISVKPSQPIVFTNDFTYTSANGNAITLKGPWFQFSVSVDNQSNTPVTIIALHIEVTGVTETGSFDTNKVDWVPAGENINSDTLSCFFDDYGEFEAKGNAGSSGPLSYVATNSSSGCPNGTLTFRAGNNPKPQQTSFIRYTVKVKPEGYFGKRGDPTDRFDGYTTVYTQ